MTKKVLTHVREQVNIDYATFLEVNEKVLTFARKNGVPVADVQFEVDCGEEYGSSYARVYLVCKRLETDEERDVRLQREKENKKRQAEWDARQLEALKKKYPEQFK